MADDQTVITPDSVPEGYAPFSTSSTDPSGGTKTTVGYAPRRPIQPPTGGIGVPDLGPAYAQAFQNLPVDQAVKAIEAATRFQGQRGYMRDLQNGMNAAQAFAKWGPMLFHQATGIPEAIDRSVPTPITPQQMIQNRLNQQKFESAQAAAKAKADAAAAKANAPRLHFGQSGEIIQETGKPEEPIKVVRKAKDKPDKQATITVPLNPDNPDGAKITGPADNPDVMEAVKRHEEALKPKPEPPKVGLLDKAKALLTGTPAAAPQGPKTVTTKEQYDALKSGDIYVGKDGKKYRKP